MFFIPGFIISAVTLPGVIVHEFAHQFFCRLFRVAVFDVCYFRFGNPAGYVIHEVPKKVSHQIWIGIGPFFVNTILGALIALPASIPFFTFSSANLLDYALLWLGVSVAMHAFPSTGDAKSIWDSVKESSAGIRIVATPIVGLIYLCSFGSVFWLDLIYGALVSLSIPYLIIALVS